MPSLLPPGCACVAEFARTRRATAAGAACERLIAPILYTQCGGGLFMNERLWWYRRARDACYPKWLERPHNVALRDYPAGASLQVPARTTNSPAQSPAR